MKRSRRDQSHTTNVMPTSFKLRIAAILHNLKRGTQSNSLLSYPYGYSVRRMATKKITFDHGDLFARKDFGKTLLKFLLVEREFVSGSLVVSVNAPFGSGKSTFFEMWQTWINESEDVETADAHVLLLRGCLKMNKRG